MNVTDPLQRDDVSVAQLVPSHRVHHVLPDQLLHTLLGHHSPPKTGPD